MGNDRYARRKDSRRFERMHQAVKAMKEEMEKMNINYEASSFVIPKRKRRKSICGPSRRQKKKTKEIRAQIWSEKRKPKRKSMIEEKLEDANSAISTLRNALEGEETYTLLIDDDGEMPVREDLSDKQLNRVRMQARALCRYYMKLAKAMEEATVEAPMYTRTVRKLGVSAFQRLTDAFAVCSSVCCSGCSLLNVFSCGASRAVLGERKHSTIGY